MSEFPSDRGESSRGGRGASQGFSYKDSQGAGSYLDRVGGYKGAQDGTGYPDVGVGPGRGPPYMSHGGYMPHHPAFGGPMPGMPYGYPPHMGGYGYPYGGQYPGGMGGYPPSMHPGMGSAYGMHGAMPGMPGMPPHPSMSGPSAMSGAHMTRHKQEMEGNMPSSKASNDQDKQAGSSESKIHRPDPKQSEIHRPDPKQSEMPYGVRSDLASSKSYDKSSTSERLDSEKSHKKGDFKGSANSNQSTLASDTSSKRESHGSGLNTQSTEVGQSGPPDRPDSGLSNKPDSKTADETTSRPEKLSVVPEPGEEEDTNDSLVPSEDDSMAGFDEEENFGIGCSDREMSPNSDILDLPESMDSNPPDSQTSSTTASRRAATHELSEDSDSDSDLSKRRPVLEGNSSQSSASGNSENKKNKSKRPTRQGSRNKSDAVARASPYSHENSPLSNRTSPLPKSSTHPGSPFSHSSSPQPGQGSGRQSRLAGLASSQNSASQLQPQTADDNTRCQTTDPDMSHTKATDNSTNKATSDPQVSKDDDDPISSQLKNILKTQLDQLAAWKAQDAEDARLKKEQDEKHRGESPNQMDISQKQSPSNEHPVTKQSEPDISSVNESDKKSDQKSDSDIAETSADQIPEGKGNKRGKGDISDSDFSPDSSSEEESGDENEAELENSSSESDEEILAALAEDRMPSDEENIDLSSSEDEESTKMNLDDDMPQTGLSLECPSSDIEEPLLGLDTSLDMSTEFPDSAKKSKNKKSKSAQLKDEEGSKDATGSQSKSKSGKVKGKPKRKRKKDADAGDSAAEDKEDKTKSKRKRKRKGQKEDGDSKKRKKQKKEDQDEEGEKHHKSKFERKNIRKIMGENELDAETLEAQKEEMERKHRLMEMQERIRQGRLAEKEKQHSELMALLGDQADSKEVEKEELISLLKEKKEKKKEEEHPGFPVPDVIELSSSDEDNDVVVLPSEEPEDSDEDDPTNSGSHTNDAMNQPDIHGRVLVNVGHPPEEPDIFLAPQLSRAIKPHQIGGVRFLYDNLVESLERYKTSNGFGCILAHSMGLGKTLQVISFTDCILRHTEARNVMCIVPVNTLQNWLAEFNMWLPDGKDIPEHVSRDDVWPREFKVYIINDNQKSNAARAEVVEEWREKGGVLLLGYEMYRLLTSRKLTGGRPRKKRNTNNSSEVIDIDEEDKTKELATKMYAALVRPGPDIVICDEGHRIKNSHASISQALKNIRTKRRVVLTGYPLQNNLLEYWCMVDFTRPNFLGNKTEFSNMFERPIMNGQCMDSTPQDTRLMRFRSHVLHSLLEGFVQRRGHTVLKYSLPDKEEHVLLLRMSSIQRKLYKGFLDMIQEESNETWATTNPIKAFSVCCKIWNHPDVLYKMVEAKKNSALEDDLDIDPNAEGTTKRGRGKGKGGKASFPASPATAVNGNMSGRNTPQSGMMPGPMPGPNMPPGGMPMNQNMPPGGMMNNFNMPPGGMNQGQNWYPGNMQNQNMYPNQNMPGMMQNQNNMPPGGMMQNSQNMPPGGMMHNQNMPPGGMMQNHMSPGGMMENQNMSSDGMSNPNMSGNMMSNPSMMSGGMMSDGSMPQNEPNFPSAGSMSNQNMGPGGMMSNQNMPPGGMMQNQNMPPGGINQNMHPGGMMPNQNMPPGGMMPNQNMTPGGMMPNQNMPPGGMMSNQNWSSGGMMTNQNMMCGGGMMGQNMNSGDPMMKHPPGNSGVFGDNQQNVKTEKLETDSDSKDTKDVKSVKQEGAKVKQEDIKSESGPDVKVKSEEDVKKEDVKPDIKKEGDSAPGSATPSVVGDDPAPVDTKKEQQVISYEWAYDMIKDYQLGVLEHGPKMVVLMGLLEECIRCGDKMLVFSQSLFTLTLVEEFLSRHMVPIEGLCERWQKNKNYFRLDGSTSAMDREKLIGQFNAPDSRIHLFLLSTRAGCLGINLIGANRVVVMDASWNPCHDCQAVCRVYRYGQQKRCFVYRLVTDNCMEKKIYDRQINKQGMSDRVVDELQPQNNFTKKQVDMLMDYEEKELPHIDPRCGDNLQDSVLCSVMKKHHRWFTKDPFTHESLLIDRKDQKLTKTEKRLAKQGYEMEKKLSVSYSRPSYASFYPRMGPGGMVRPPLIRGPHVVMANRPVASVRPMMSTPLPMQVKPGQRGGPQTIPISSLLRPGVSVHQVQTTTDIVIPGTNTVTQTGNRIPAGETVLVIKTPKGVYIRTNQGKIFAVRSAPAVKGDSAAASVAGASTSTTSTTSTTTVGQPGTAAATTTTTQAVALAGNKGSLVTNKDGLVSQIVKVSSMSAGKPVVTVTKRIVKLSDLRAGGAKPGTTTVTPSVNLKDGKFAFNNLLANRGGVKPGTIPLEILAKNKDMKITPGNPGVVLTTAVSSSNKMPNKWQQIHLGEKAGDSSKGTRLIPPGVKVVRLPSGQTMPIPESWKKISMPQISSQKSATKSDSKEADNDKKEDDKDVEGGKAEESAEGTPADKQPDASSKSPAGSKRDDSSMDTMEDSQSSRASLGDSSQDSSQGNSKPESNAAMDKADSSKPGSQPLHRPFGSPGHSSSSNSNTFMGSDNSGAAMNQPSVTDGKGLATKTLSFNIASLTGQTSTTASSQATSLASSQSDSTLPVSIPTPSFMPNFNLNQSNASTGQANTSAVTAVPRAPGAPDSTNVTLARPGVTMTTTGGQGSLAPGAAAAQNTPEKPAPKKRVRKSRAKPKPNNSTNFNIANLASSSGKGGPSNMSGYPGYSQGMGTGPGGYPNSNTYMDGYPQQGMNQGPYPGGMGPDGYNSSSMGPGYQGMNQGMGANRYPGMNPGMGGGSGYGESMGEYGSGYNPGMRSMGQGSNSAMSGPGDNSTMMGMGSPDPYMDINMANNSMNQGNMGPNTMGQGNLGQSGMSQGNMSSSGLNQEDMSQGGMNQRYRNLSGMSQGDMNQGNMAQGSMNQGNMGQGSMNQGNMSQGSMNQGNMGQGSMNQGSMGQGSMNQGSMGQGGLNQGNMGQSGMNQGNMGQSGMNQGNMGQSGMNQGNMGQSGMHQGSRGQSGMGNMGQSGMHQGNMGQGSMGNMGPSGMSQSGMNQGGGMGQGGMNQRNMNQSSMNQGNMGPSGIHQGNMGQSGMTPGSMGPSGMNPGSMGPSDMGPGNLGPSGMEQGSMNKGNASQSSMSPMGPNSYSQLGGSQTAWNEHTNQNFSQSQDKSKLGLSDGRVSSGHRSADQSPMAQAVGSSRSNVDQGHLGSSESNVGSAKMSPGYMSQTGKSEKSLDKSIPGANHSISGSSASNSPARSAFSPRDTTAMASSHSLMGSDRAGIDSSRSGPTQSAMDASPSSLGMNPSSSRVGSGQSAFTSSYPGSMGNYSSGMQSSAYGMNPSGMYGNSSNPWYPSSGMWGGQGYPSNMPNPMYGSGYGGMDPSMSYGSDPVGASRSMYGDSSDRSMYGSSYPSYMPPTPYSYGMPSSSMYPGGGAPRMPYSSGGMGTGSPMSHAGGMPMPGNPMSLGDDLPDILDLDQQKRK